MNMNEARKYYSREDIQQALLRASKDREVAGVFREIKRDEKTTGGGFSERPNVLLYPNDIMSFVNRGVIEFHCSIERWSQPMGLSQSNYSQLRSGWDLVLDIDCEQTDHGKIASRVFLWALEKHGIKADIKFTGGTGFHLGIPWESMPGKIDYKETKGLFPDIARTMALYLKDYAEERMAKELLKNYTPEQLAEQVNKPLGKILTEDGIEPYEILDVDPVLISPRHLFRMPYSLNKKTLLVSLPLNPAKIDEFEKEDARPENVRAIRGFLENGEKDQASLLMAEAMDWSMNRKAVEERKPYKILEIGRALPESSFPPCIKGTLLGLSDGKKRSLFVLLNFLRSVKWDWESIERLLMEWNSRNKPPLSESTVRSQIRYHMAKEKAVLPPNCFHPGWYTDYGVCQPDSLCRTIKNPVNYAAKRARGR